MSIWKLVFRSLIFYRRTHAGTILGTALATAILVGALVVGDSVRLSLRQMVSDRLGNTIYALQSDTRFFGESLAERISHDLGTTVAPILQTKGIAITGGGEEKANQVQVIGVDDKISRISNTAPEYWHISNGEVVINQRLATRLHLKKGDQFLLRLLKKETFSRDAPLSRDTDLTIARRVTVKSIAGVSDFGQFNLKSSQIIPYTIFVSLSELAASMDVRDRANTLLIADDADNPLPQEKVKESLEKVWTLNDVGIYLNEIEENKLVELKSNRIFLEPAISAAVQKLDYEIVPVFTYFVNELRSGDNSTPYSFVSAPGKPIVPSDIGNHEIIINRWLAGDLHVKVGDPISLSYYVIGPMRQLIEKKVEFRIKSIVPLSGIYADQSLMPDFPGLAGEENCRDWDPGIPLNFDKIRDKDEDYWDNYRGTPKAFISLGAAQSLWQNRFGNLTAIRFHDESIIHIEQELKNVLDPAAFGLVFRAVREDGIRASMESVDFAELFLGLSFFIIIASMILTGLLFVFSIEQRSSETGLYLALGFTTKVIRRIVFLESGVLTIIGVLMGGILGLVYNQLVLVGLKTIWQGAVGTTALSIHIEMSSVLTGIFAGLLIALLTMMLVIRKYTQLSVSQLQAGSRGTDLKLSKRRSLWSLITGISGLLISIIIIAFTGAGRGKEATAAFFTAGTLMLISGIALTSFYLDRMQKFSAKKPDLLKLGMRNMSRSKLRSLLLVGLLASGLFIVFTVGANRHGAIQDPYVRSSGTGGFAFYIQTMMPVLYDLNSEKGRDFYHLEELGQNSISFIPFRRREGEDASCLNLNRVSMPQLLGVKPENLNDRKTFGFLITIDTVDTENPWLSLNLDLGNNVIPGIADETVIIWGLGKSVGDTIEYLDENGDKFGIKLVAGLANSVFQGNILISEQSFIKRYPSESGYHLFLVNSPAEMSDSVNNRLSWSMQDLGIDISSTSERLAAFNEVENTYLSIFLILGGFGMILGTIGLGIIVLRNIMERRGELALLRAVGFNRSSINKMIMAEHILVLLIGTACGFFTAFIAVFPALIIPGGAIPYITVLSTLLIILLSGIIWIYLATAFAIRGDLLPVLRNE